MVVGRDGVQVEDDADDAEDQEGGEDDAAAPLGWPAVAAAVAAIGVCGAELEALEGGAQGQRGCRLVVLGVWCAEEFVGALV